MLNLKLNSIKDLDLTHNSWVLDVETTTGKGTEHTSPIPFRRVGSAPNSLVSIGLFEVNKRQFTFGTGSFDLKTGVYNVPGIFIKPWAKSNCVLIGHNIKFDILWLLAEGLMTIDELINNVILIDTSIIAHRLSGHTHKFPSLKDCCIYEGLTVSKTDKVSEFWKAGYDTIDIPPSILKEYLTNDLLITDNLFWTYLRKYPELKSDVMLMLDMEALKSTCVLEYNGLPVNYQAFLDRQIELNRQVASLELNITALLTTAALDLRKAATLDSEGREIECVEVYKLIAKREAMYKYLLYGMEVELPCTSYLEGKPTYKTGKRKGEYKTKASKFLIGNADQNDIPNPLSQHTIKKLLDENKIKAPALGKLLIEHAIYNKEKSTYFDGIAPYLCVKDETTTLRGSLNFTATSTGRLSSSKPNLQNLSGKDID